MAYRADATRMVEVVLNPSKGVVDGHVEDNGECRR